MLDVPELTGPALFDCELLAHSTCRGAKWPGNFEYTDMFLFAVPAGGYALKTRRSVRQLKDKTASVVTEVETKYFASVDALLRCLTGIAEAIDLTRQLLHQAVKTDEAISLVLQEVSAVG